MQETPPRAIGRYRIQGEIGRGMMGVVYQALDPDLERTVALKTIRLAFPVSDKERQAFEKRFLAEARAAAALSHPGIVMVHDVGRDAETGTLYIALEHLQGRTLAERSGGSALDWREALRLTARLAEALHHAHARGIVHRDIKPANIMVLPSGEPKIMDFGIAKLPAAHLTSTGEFFGTPAYMSPEQVSGEAVDGRSDLFSLGAVLYLLLTGRPAFEAEHVAAIVARVAHLDPRAPSRVVSGLTSGVDRLLARALAKRPADRYLDGKAFARDIEDVLAGREPRHGRTWTPQRGHGALASPLAREEPETADLRHQAAAPAAGASPLQRLTHRIGTRGLLLLGGLAAAGLLGSFLLQGTLPIPTLPPLVEPGHMELRFEHALKSGTLRVWIDERLVLEEPLESRVTEDLVVLRLRKGREEKTLDVPPGERVVRVQVTGDGVNASRSIRGTFESGVTRRLKAEMGGLLRRNLTLVWGSEAPRPPGTP